LGDIPYTDIDNAISNFDSNDSNRNTPILLSYLPHGLNHNTFKPLDPATPELVEYKNKRSKIKIICNKHDEFIQTADSHLRGRGCYHCGLEKIS
jgi:hypothetical protein